ncbi:hypothetical protein A1O1_00270 [Capronia coronata CBS 617.96]|uniref:Uncharacterized protein n=1 Tax=Capronia coronata CBS 617.96 TaxID=1182541 RepID=W9Z0Q4_9EURO|nr:uncharacterized protein A1O1_00270 [Capronia coronata CBS 617.96]EXJ95151.1 hypothetical protein A1O1_00270 [Capronia coronata CBS 617.96]
MAPLKATTPAPVAETSDLPTMPVVKCSRQNQNVWPQDFYDGNRYYQGFTRKKQFPNCKCTRCRGAHPTKYHDICSRLYETWKLKGSGGHCNAPTRCSNRESHNTEDCGLGEFTDHPDNPELPQELQPFLRPWPKNTSRVPFPLYYYVGDAYPIPNADCPKLPSPWERGFKAGLWDKRLGLAYSFEVAKSIALGYEKPDYVAGKYPSDQTLMQTASAKNGRADNFLGDVKMALDLPPSANSTTGSE